MTNSPPQLSKLTIALIFIGLLGATTLIFNNVLKHQHNPNQKPNVSFNGAGKAEVTLKQNRAGHYVATGKINNQPVVFLVDTGATYVAVPEKIAHKLGLKKGHPFQAETANGMSRSYFTTIDKITLGNIEMTNVPASISSGMQFDEVLLGMSFLKHLKITQDGKKLILGINHDNN